MKILRYTGERQLEVLEGADTLRGADSIGDFARSQGDGNYIMDTQEGRYVEFSVAGDEVSGLDVGGYKYGNPTQAVKDGEPFFNGMSTDSINNGYVVQEEL